MLQELCRLRGLAFAARAKANYWSWGSRGDDRYWHQICHLTRAQEGAGASDPTMDGSGPERAETSFASFGACSEHQLSRGIGKYYFRPGKVQAINI